MKNVAPPARLALLMEEYAIKHGSVFHKIFGTADPFKSLTNCADPSPENYLNSRTPKAELTVFKVLIIMENKYFGNLNVGVKST